MHIPLILVPILPGIVLGGCADLFMHDDRSQPVTFETRTVDGRLMDVAWCRLSNADGATTVLSGKPVAVTVSSKDLDVICAYPNLDPARGKLIARKVDGEHAWKSAAYAYPARVQLVFGHSLVFDPADEINGVALVGKPPEAPIAKR
jgi:hypothetical protein